MSLILKYFNFKLKEKIAGFDLDGTLIDTKSGKTFAINNSDWKFKFENIKDKLEELIKDNYCIIIVTNQKGLKSEELILDWKEKINKISIKLNLPFMVLASIENNNFRKPLIGFEKEFSNYDKKNSFYCGDACGRENDFSDTDYKFALNLNIKFYSPEELFLKEDKLIKNIKYYDDSIFDNKNKPFKPKNKDLIIFVGLPGSGKSSYIRNNILNNGKISYQLINQDIVKNLDKCIKLCEEYMKRDMSIIIDRTNPTKKDRELFISLAKKYNYTNIRCFKMKTTEELALHNNIYRNITTSTSLVPILVYRIYNKNYEAPSHSEGFTKIYPIYPVKPDDKKYLKYYY